MEIRKIVGATTEEVGKNLKNALKRLGYDFYPTYTGTGIKLQDVRLSDEYVKKYGRNVSPYTGRRGRILGWYNWVEVNNTINNVLDRLHASANVHSLHGKLKIREGKHGFTESDWNEWGEKNVGSVVNPVRAKDAWLPERMRKDWQAKRLAEIL
jgi:hypothetical protein